jgi:hypothetical protein
VRILDLLIMSARAVFKPASHPGSDPKLCRGAVAGASLSLAGCSTPRAGSGWPVAGEPPRVIMQVLGRVETGVPMEYLADIKQRPDL